MCGRVMFVVSELGTFGFSSGFSEIREHFSCFNVSPKPFTSFHFSLTHSLILFHLHTIHGYELWPTTTGVYKLQISLVLLKSLSLSSNKGRLNLGLLTLIMMAQDPTYIGNKTLEYLYDMFKAASSTPYGNLPTTILVNGDLLLLCCCRRFKLF